MSSVAKSLQDLMMLYKKGGLCCGQALFCCHDHVLPQTLCYLWHWLGPFPLGHGICLAEFVFTTDFPKTQWFCKMGGEQIQGRATMAYSQWCHTRTRPPL